MNQTTFQPTPFHQDTLLEIFSHLDVRNLYVCLCVNRCWFQICDTTDSIWQHVFRRSIVAAEQWKQFYGEVGKFPLPEKIYQILRAPCPFWNTKRVFQTHVLVLMPPTVNGSHLTLDSLNELIQKPKQGPSTQYGEYDRTIQATYGTTSFNKPYWILITKDVLPGSKGPNKQRPGLGYRLPKTIEAAASQLTHFASFKTELFKDTYTICSETVGTNNDSIIVGDFYPPNRLAPFTGLDITRDSRTKKAKGSAALRVFPIKLI